MAGTDRPDNLAVISLAPVQCAPCSHEPCEDLRPVARVKDDQTHSLDDALIYAVDHGVLHEVMTCVTPPCQHVRVIQDVIGEAVLRQFERGSSYSGGIAEVFPNP